MSGNISVFSTILEDLLDTISSGFSICDPFQGPNPSVLFHSHFDWHSSVHGHWAFLIACRMRGREKSHPEVEKILRRFSVENLCRERDYLRENGSFELPYGQSWLLLLLPELLRWFDVDKPEVVVIQELQIETLERVLTWLENSSYPDGAQGRFFLGAHDSWTMAYFLVKMANITHGRLADIDAKFQAAFPKMTTQTSLWDFHSPLCLANVINGTTDCPVIGTSSVCKPTQIEIQNCHTPGLIVTSYWPHAFSAGCGNHESKQILAGHMAGFMADVEWKGDFALTTHWVPQFLFFAVWLACGRP